MQLTRHDNEANERVKERDGPRICKFLPSDHAKNYMPFHHLSREHMETMGEVNVC